MAAFSMLDVLRAQLAPSGITVMELVPPAVPTAGQEQVNPHALPLDGFLAEVTELFSANPTPQEVLVKGVHMHRWAERDGQVCGAGCEAAGGAFGTLNWTYANGPTTCGGRPRRAAS